MKQEHHYSSEASRFFPSILPHRIKPQKPSSFRNIMSKKNQPKKRYNTIQSEHRPILKNHVFGSKNSQLNSVTDMIRQYYIRLNKKSQYSHKTFQTEDDLQEQLIQNEKDIKLNQDALKLQRVINKNQAIIPLKIKQPQKIQSKQFNNNSSIYEKKLEMTKLYLQKNTVVQGKSIIDIKKKASFINTSQRTFNVSPDKEQAHSQKIRNNYTQAKQEVLISKTTECDNKNNADHIFAPYKQLQIRRKTKFLALKNQKIMLTPWQLADDNSEL